jgi:hypothetical protein
MAGGAVRDVLEVEAGGGAVGICEDGGALRDLGLAAIARGHLKTAPGESGLDEGPNVRVLDEREAEEPGGYLAGDVVSGGAEATGDDDDVSAREGLYEGDANGVAIGNGDLASDAKAEREELLAEEGEMGVEGVAEEELGTGVDDFDKHWEKDGGKFEVFGARMHTVSGIRVFTIICDGRDSSVLDFEFQISKSNWQVANGRGRGARG